MFKKFKPNFLVVVIAALIVEMALLNNATDKGVGAFAADKIVISDMSNTVYGDKSDSNEMAASTEYTIDAKNWSESDYIEESKMIFSKSKDASAARAIINRGISNCSETSKLSYYYALYDSAVVKDIDDFKKISSEYYHKSDSTSSSYGDFYESAYKFDARLAKNSTAAYVKYVLNGNTTQFEASFFMDPKNTHNACKFQVYGDGALLYETGFLSVDDKPVYASINTTDVEILEIKATCREGYGYGIPSAYMGNPKAYNTISESDFI